MDKHQFLSELQLVSERLTDILLKFPEDLTKEDMEDVEGVAAILEDLYDKIAQNAVNEGG